MNDYTYEDVVRLQEHFAAIGNFSVYIYGLEKKEGWKNLPWDKVINVEGGGMHRLSIPIGLSFTASIDNSPVVVRWSIDLEPSEANGSSIYQFDSEKVTWIYNRLNHPGKKMMSRHFKEIVLPAIKKLTNEVFESYNKCKLSQITVENCINNLGE